MFFAMNDMQDPLDSFRCCSNHSRSARSGRWDSEDGRCRRDGQKAGGAGRVIGEESGKFHEGPNASVRVESGLLLRLPHPVLTGSSGNAGTALEFGPRHSFGFKPQRFLFGLLRVAALIFGRFGLELPAHKGAMPVAHRVFGKPQSGGCAHIPDAFRKELQRLLSSRGVGGFVGARSLNSDRWLVRLGHRQSARGCWPRADASDQPTKDSKVRSCTSP